jgi:hypothetical protein
LFPQKIKLVITLCFLPVTVMPFLLGDTQEMQTVKTQTTKKINPKGVLFGFIKSIRRIVRTSRCCGGQKFRRYARLRFAF